MNKIEKGRNGFNSLLNDMANSKNSLVVVIIIIIIAALCGAGYYFLVLKKPAEEPIVWDGAYQMAGELTCEGDIPNLTTIPMNTVVTVSSNKIIEQFQGTTESFEIDEQGKATESVGPTDIGGITTTIQVNYQFYQEEGVYKFTATGAMDMSVVKDGKTYSSTCSGTITGIKQ
jgi:flagellar basal body-associated protein FliL